MSLFLKVRKSRAERARKKILSLGVYDGSRKVESEKEHILFPITKKVSIPSCLVVSRRGVRQEKKPRSLSESLSKVLSKKELSLVPSSFDVVGDIAILEFEKEFPKGKKKIVARALLETFPSVRVVVEKSDKVSGEYRVRGIKHLAGEKRTDTVHTEYGCKYKVDVACDYFSPRLGTERMRVASQVAEGERVLVLFAGVGPYAILIAKKRKPSEVVAVELNPHAVSAMKENVKLNKADVKVVLGDAKKVTKKLGVFDRIIMPLPKDAGDFLAVALPALKEGGAINFYTFAVSAKEAEENLTVKVIKLGHKPKIIQTAECGSYSARLSRYCVDFRI